jgi:glycosyltransferase involved in cell wall biosynthesis
MTTRSRIAVVSPFLDKKHGTERCVVEQVERLARDHGYEVHLYCQALEDISDIHVSGGRERVLPRGAVTNRLIWHRVSSIPGPHLLKYIWWFFANHLQRWNDRRFRGLDYDLVYSPGINCLDADAIVVHIVFHEFYRLVIEDLRLRQLPLRAVPRAIHRRLYYQLAMALERKIYTDPHVALAAVSRLTAQEIDRFFARRDVRVIPNAVELSIFNPEACSCRRTEARRRLQLEEQDFVLLLIGNDWKKKGVDTLLEAAARCLDLPCKVLIVGHDDRVPYDRIICDLGLRARVRFVEPSKDVVQFYAAADAYTGPSLHDSFALPPAEAMACGLPVITAINNGGSEMITDGVDGFLLHDPKDPEELSETIRKLYENPPLREEVGRKAAIVAKEFTWERNAQQVFEFLENAKIGKRR